MMIGCDCGEIGECWEGVWGGEEVSSNICDGVRR